MPQILEFREIDGELWARVGKPGEFSSGITLWTPGEQTEFHQANYAAGLDAAVEIAAMWAPSGPPRDTGMEIAKAILALVKEEG